MAWYRAGTVTVANGSPTVTGAGTDFVANAQIGHAFLGPDGKVYEIAQVEAAGQIVLSAPYLGGSGGGQGYAIMPTSSFARDLALGAAQLLNTFAEMRDTIGKGFFPDGGAVAPAISFGADRDTGLYRSAGNEISVATGGLQRARFTADGHLQVEGLGKSVGYSVADRFALGGQSVAQYGLTSGVILPGNPNAATVLSGYAGLVLAAGSAERARIDQNGNLLAGVTQGTDHTFARQVDQGQAVARILSIAAGADQSVVVAAVNRYTPSGTGAALYLGMNNATGRSLNASGTLNASGADYAEYMTKASGCGTIAKGDVCGVDRDGRLTKLWADAISFVIKSTDPSYVGGDVWGQSVGPRPEGPGEEPSAPIAPPAAPASDDEAAEEAWRASVVAYPGQLAAYQSAHAAWTDAKAAYDTALPAWEAALEAERQKVDRIAFSGQVPVNVTGDFAVGDYLIAVAAGAGIKAVAVPAHTITFDQYRRRLGKVWAVRDGRAWVDVQHG